MNRAVLIAVTAAAAPFALSAGVAMAAAGGGALTASGGSCTAAPAASTVKPAGAPAGEWDAAQVANARIIYATGVQLGLPAQAEIIALATAMQESDLQNLSYGTSDSLGLFQQRPSQGWGTPAQVMDPVYAATQFYDHLVQVPGWRSMPLTEAAQAVQISMYPDAYARWQAPATALAASFGASTSTVTTISCASTSSSPSGSGVPDSGTIKLPSWYSLPAGTSPQAAIAIAYALAQLGKPYIWGGTGPVGYDCSGLVMMAYQAAGIELPRVTYTQVDMGTAVPSFADLRPGDLLFEAGSDGTDANPGHVGMYIGDGLVIQAPYTGADINLTPASEWQPDTVDIRRITSLSMCRLSFLMSLSRITCRLNVACDMFVRKCRRGSVLTGRTSASIASVTLAAQRADQVGVRYRRADGEFAETTLGRVAPGDVIAGLPVREFRWYKGRKHYSGWYWSSTMCRLVAYESRLELARIMLADFDPEVAGLAAQPFQITASDGGQDRRHVPDLLLVGRDGAVTVVDAIYELSNREQDSVSRATEASRNITRTHDHPRPKP